LSIALLTSIAAQERQEPAVRSVGRGAPVSAPLYVVPTNPADMPAPDMYGRPWAKIRERHFEQGMSRPKEDDIFDFE